MAWWCFATMRCNEYPVNYKSPSLSWAFLIGLNIPQRPHSFRSLFQYSWLASDDAEKSIGQTPLMKRLFFPTPLRIPPHRLPLRGVSISISFHIAGSNSVGPFTPRVYTGGYHGLFNVWLS